MLEYAFWMKLRWLKAISLPVRVVDDGCRSGYRCCRMSRACTKSQSLMKGDAVTSQALSWLLSVMMAWPAPTVSTKRICAAGVPAS